MNRSDRKTMTPAFGQLAWLAFLMVSLIVAVSACSTPTQANNVLEEQVARGAYLVTIGGCNDCHTPWKLGDNGPEPDASRMLSGHPQDFALEPVAMTDGWGWAGAPTNTAFSGPWGVSFTANLTPDEDTGLGSWNEEIFMNTLRSGRHWGQSRPILPPMPWFNYGRMTDDDLKAVFAYLRSIPPVHNEVPLPIPPGGVDTVVYFE